MLYVCFFQNIKILSETVRGEGGGRTKLQGTHGIVWALPLLGRQADGNLGQGWERRVLLPGPTHLEGWQAGGFLCSEPAENSSFLFPGRARRAPCSVLLLPCTRPWSWFGLQILETDTFSQLEGCEGSRVRVLGTDAPECPSPLVYEEGKRTEGGAWHGI